MLRLGDGDEVQTMTLRNVYYVPDFGKNLLSLGQLQKDGHDIALAENGFITRKEGHEFLLAERLQNNMYVVRHVEDTPVSANTASLVTSKATLMEWHERLGHVHFDVIRKMSTTVDGIGREQRESTLPSMPIWETSACIP